MVLPLVEQKLNTLPTQPGVYLMRDVGGEVIYVGKAINLRNRVRSYFHAPNPYDGKVAALVERIADLEWIITESELEALILEMNLIKRYRPKYNVRLKDDKRYPYIKVSWQDPFPKVFLTRRMENDGARYFGPFTAAWAVYETLDTLRKVFPYLTCDREITGHDRRACLYYDIGLCNAPCIGAVLKDEYRATIDRLCQFLQGHSEAVKQQIRDKVAQSAERMEFERAAYYRDQLQALDRITEHQKVVSTDLVDQDVIAFAQDDGTACVQVFFVRGGKLLGREYFVLEGTDDEKSEQVLSSFVKQFYNEAAYVPPEILLAEHLDEARIIEAWLKQHSGQTVTLNVPRSGQSSELLDMAAENARATLGALKQQWLADETKHLQAVQELQEALGMDQPPLRIECYDISNIQGAHAVGAMVVFERGAAKKSDYRKFKIKTVEGPNDFASMQEMLRRRFRRYHDARQDQAVWQPSGAETGGPPVPASSAALQNSGLARSESGGGVSGPAPDDAAPPPGAKTRGSKRKPPTAAAKNDESWGQMPDLVVIDGGKGQLSAALEVFQEQRIEGVQLIGLAKQQEEIFRPGHSESLRLPRHAPALHLLQRIRDEAHRFGITYHRSLRAKRGLASQLDSIPGIGPARRRALLAHFGSLDKIRAAPVEEIAAVEGMTRKSAEKLKEHL